MLRPMIRLMAVALLAGATVVQAAGPVAGDRLVPFDVRDIQGGTWDAARLSSADLAVLYFFSTSCEPCVEGMRELQNIAGERLPVLAIGKQEPAALESFAGAHGIRLPMAAAQRDLLKSYGAQYVFPTTYVLGPGGVVMDRFQGATPVRALTLTLADRQLQRGQYGAARDLYQRAATDDPARALAGVGYAYLKEGDLDQAEATFAQLAAAGGVEQQRRGEEGLAEVRLARGDADGALAAGSRLASAADASPAAHLIKAKALFEKGQTSEAAQAVQTAAARVQEADFSWQRADVYLAEGNVGRAQADSEIALTSYEKAEAADPYSVAAPSNKAVVLMEDRQQPEEAVKVLERTRERAPDDALAASLLRQAQAAAASKDDLSRQRYIDQMVDKLAQRYRAGQAAPPSSGDDWTSPPPVVSVHHFEPQGRALLGRIGHDAAVKSELNLALQRQGLPVVERDILDALLQELNLGSSDLAQPDEALRLGRVMAARLIATGSLFAGEGQRPGMVSMRLVDTESTRIVGSFAERGRVLDPLAVAEALAGKITGVVREKYPLRGRIALAEGDVVVINLGARHGVQPGMVFNVYGSSRAIELNGKVLGYRHTSAGKARVVEVEEQLAYVQALEQTGGWSKNQKVELAQQ